MLTRLLSALAAVLLSRVALGQGEVQPPPTPAPAPAAGAPAPLAAEADADTSPTAHPAVPEAGGSTNPSATGAVTAADPPSASAAPSQTVPAAEVQALRGPLLLQVEGFEDAAAVEELRAALSAEFGCLVILRPEDARFAPQGRIVVARHAETRELAITFVDAAEQSSTRVVQEPADPLERARTVTLLAGTLARSPLEEAEPAAARGAVAETVLPPPTHAAVASIFYPLATNFDVPDVHTYFAFSLLYGRIGSLDGLGLGMLQFASRGVQGAQVAFLGNSAGGPVAGVQAAFGVNSAGALGGLQVAAINHVADDASGAQLGFLNYAGGSVTGAQAGFSVNIGGNVEGAQVGLVNVAKDVKGMQIGIFNVADDVDGVPIGLVSVTKKGGVHPMAWYSNLTPFNAGLRFATEYTYTILQASYDVEDDMVGPGFGIGGSVPIFLEDLYVDIELSETYLFSDGRDANQGKSLTRLRGAIRYQIFPHLSVFAGGGYAGKVEPTREPDGNLGSHYYESRGEFVAGIGL